MKKNFCFLAIGAVVMLGLLLNTSPAAAALVPFGGYTIVEAEPFASGGTAGNTTAVGGGFFSAPADAPGIWRNRTVSAFVTDYENVPLATNRVFDTTNGAPELVTTVSLPAAGIYEVAIVYLYAQNSDTDAGLLANLNGVVDPSIPAHFFDRSEVDLTVGSPPTGSWAIGLAVLGTTSAGATSFTVNVDENDDLGGGAYGRAGYIGVAYRLVAIPEPSSFALVGMGAVGLLLRRRQ